MEEKLLIEGQYDYIKKLKIVTLIVAALAGCSFLLGQIFSKMADKYWEEAHYAPNKLDPAGKTLSRYADNCSIIFLICSIIIIILIITLFCLARTKIVVTDRRVYGTALWGKRVDLPMDSISAVATSAFKGIKVATSSGRIAFGGLSNRDEVHSAISKQLVARQEQRANPVVVTTVNNNDDLAKYKEYLDKGLITQEEYDAKKKQILGL